MESACPDLDFITRRNIFSLKSGTQIPGYTGHRPGVRFGFGSTYGDLTHQLKSMNKLDDPRSFMEDPPMTSSNGSQCGPAQLSGRKLGSQNPKNNSSAMEKLLKGADLNDEELEHGRWPTVHFKMLPPTGLKSGYTGYVPRLRYHFGSSYNRSSNEAKEEFSYLQQIDRGDQTDANSSLDAMLFAKYGEQLQKPLIPVNDNDKVLEELLKFEQQRHLDLQEDLQHPSVDYQGHIPMGLQPPGHTARSRRLSETANKYRDTSPINHINSCFI